MFTQFFAVPNLLMICRIVVIGFLQGIKDDFYD